MLREITLEGTPEEMGEQHGSRLRSEIRALAESRMDYSLNILGRGSAAILEDVCRQFERAVQRLLPEVYVETAATARAAGLAYWKLILAGALSDVLDVAARKTGASPYVVSECSLSVMRSERGPVVAGTWDSHASAGQGLILCRRMSTTGAPTLALTTAGWPIQQGVNNLRVAVAISNMVSDAVAENGVPYIAVLPGIMRTSASTDAIYSALTALQHASARFYATADANGGVGIEVLPGRGLFRLSDDCTHTNHVLHPDAARFEGRPEAIAGSNRRLAELNDVTSSNGDLLHPGAILSMISTNANLIQRGEDSDDWTHAAFALVPNDRRILCSVVDSGEVGPSIDVEIPQEEEHQGA